MTRRQLAAGTLGLVALAVAIVLLLRESGPLAIPEARLAVPNATAAVLDTITVRGRTVEASLDGTVTQIDARDVWLTVGEDAIALRFKTPHELEVEDRVIAVGRVRARGGTRWVDVSSWAVVRADVRPPAAPVR